MVPEDRHHPSFSFIMSLEPATGLTRASSHKFIFRAAIYEDINKDLLAIDWAAELSALEVDAALDAFYDHIYRVIRHHVPLKITKPSTYPIWFST